MTPEALARLFHDAAVRHAPALDHYLKPWRDLEPWRQECAVKAAAEVLGSMSPAPLALRCGVLISGNGIAEWTTLQVNSWGVTAAQGYGVYFFRWSDDGTEIWTYIHICRIMDHEEPVPSFVDGSWERFAKSPPPLIAEHLQQYKGATMSLDELTASLPVFQSKLEPALTPGRYRSPDDVEGTIGDFDAFANCYTFHPDGHVARAIVGPGFPDGLTRIGPDATAGWVRIGDDSGAQR